MKPLKQGDKVILTKISSEDSYYTYKELLNKEYTIESNFMRWKDGWYKAVLKDENGTNWNFFEVKIKKASRRSIQASTAIILLFLILSSCVPFKRLEEPVEMVYAFNFYNLNSCEEVSVLCNNWKVKNDTLYLYKAGYYTRRLYQRAVSDMIFPPDWKWYIVKPNLKKK